MDFKLISSYNKCFEYQKVSDFKEMTTGSVLLGDFFAFEACMLSETDKTVYVKVDSELAKYISICLVKNVPVKCPVYPQNTDTDYLNDKKPGLYPDLLVPVDEDGKVELEAEKLTSLWIEAEIPADFKAGTYEISVSVNDGDAVVTEKINLDVIPAVLPEQKLKFTQWFHYDCLASYYDVEMMSEKHWEIIENFVRTAVKNGINMLLMPVFTPALDTAVGGERPTMQLVDITKNGNEYKFNFTLVDKWLEMCDRCGIKYYEVAHLFTQWGAEHAPKIMATVDGEYKKIFGWETDSLSDEYMTFLKSFLTEFKKYMSQKGLLDKCMFHMSDEPNEKHLERFCKLREELNEVLGDCVCGDALSSYEFYKTGAVRLPVVATNHIDKYIENNVPDLWAYYCCEQHTKVSNRYIANTMNRTRIIGTQFFKYEIVGFLHWGYNFYYCQYSKNLIDPYTCNDGGWTPGGDTFSVYPAPGGVAYESLHLKGFTQALSDLRAFDLAAQLTSKETVLKLMEDLAGMKVTFSEFPADFDYSEKVRFAVNQIIKDNI